MSSHISINSDSTLTIQVSRNHNKRKTFPNLKLVEKRKVTSSSKYLFMLDRSRFSREEVITKNSSETSNSPFHSSTGLPKVKKEVTFGSIEVIEYCPEDSSDGKRRGRDKKEKVNCQCVIF